MPPLIEPRRMPLPDAGQSNGCFETMRAYTGKIFRLDDHLDRLYGSAQFLGTRAPLRLRLRGELMSALKRSGLKEAVVRVALMPQKSGPARPSIVVRPAIRPSAAQYRRGLRVWVVPARKFQVSTIDPRAKYSARLGSVLAVADAHLRGADEALFLDSIGGITESTASNIGIVNGGVILTPPCWLGLLAGITRDVLFELAGGLRAPIREEPLTRHDVYNADEVFMTSTLKEVIAVTEVDGRTIASGCPGPLTERLRRAFGELVRREMGSHGHR